MHAAALMHLGFALLALPTNDNTRPLVTAEPTRFVVTRRGPGALVKVYPPFEDRELAEWVALRAAEKYRGGATVELEPIAGGSR